MTQHEIEFCAVEEIEALAKFCAQLVREGIAFHSKRRGDLIVVVMTGH